MKTRYIGINGKDMIVKDIQVKTVFSKSNLPVCDYSVNPYVGCPHACRYCYACFMKRFTNHVEPWGEFVDVKYWPEIKNTAKYSGREIFIGSVTDPYNPLESKYGRTRALLEQLRSTGVRICIQTKSDLVLRDMDLIKTFPDARVGFSINTLDEGFKNDMDHAVSIERRLNAMKQFHDNGVRTTCFISPIFPGITDVKAIIERVRGICNLIWLENLNLRGGYKADIMQYIKLKYPHLASLYNDIYNHGHRDYWQQLDKTIYEYAAKNSLMYLRNNDSVQNAFDAPPIIVNYFYHEEIRKNAK